LDWLPRISFAAIWYLTSSVGQLRFDEGSAQDRAAQPARASRLSWRERIAERQLADCRQLAERLAAEHRLAPGWTVDRSTDMLWALISTEPLERLVVDRHWPPQMYAERFAQLLRSTFATPSTSQAARTTGREPGSDTSPRHR
jgi:hypothetical protein